jgi:hypothetical protein
VTVDDAATLLLKLATGASLIAPQNPRYEAWQVNGPGMYLVACQPGTDGRRVVWDCPVVP